VFGEDTELVEQKHVEDDVDMEDVEDVLVRDSETMADVSGEDMELVGQEHAEDDDLGGIIEEEENDGRIDFEDDGFGDVMGDNGGSYGDEAGVSPQDMD
jgi:hypothetical protein